MNKLENVTLIAVDGCEPDNAQKVLRFCLDKMDFIKTKLITYQEPVEKDARIETILINKLDYRGYNEFIIKKLSDYIDTEFCLLVQTDGYILHPELWKDEFLNYDYIGAPWACFAPNLQTGNGGFSLRSKKFLEISKNHCPYTGHTNEDVVVCRVHRKLFEYHGAKYAPAEVAIQFSFEEAFPQFGHNDSSKSFGFHNKGNKKECQILKDYVYQPNNS